MPLGNGERYYSPSFGKFIQEDSFSGFLGLPQSMNRHSYVENNPLAFVDQFGFSADEPRGEMYRASRKYGLDERGGDNGWKAVLKNWAARTGYDLWNTISFGLLEQNDTLTSDYYAKRISEQQYYEGRAKIGFVAAAQLALMLVGGRVGGALTEIPAIGRYAVARFAVGAGVNVATQFAGESVEIGLGMRPEYAPVSSYAFNALLGGLMNTRARPASYREGVKRPTVRAGRLQEWAELGEGLGAPEPVVARAGASEAVATVAGGRRYSTSASDEVLSTQSSAVDLVDDMLVISKGRVVEEGRGSSSASENYIGPERQLGRSSVDDIIAPKEGAAEQLLLTSGNPTTRTLAQVRRLRGSARWQAGEQYVQEVYGSSGRRHFAVLETSGPDPIVGSGGRFVDAPVDLANRGVLANEVKIYHQWRTVKGLRQQSSVPLTEHIRQQVLKDAWLRQNRPGFDPRWIFLDAPPSAELSNFLNQHDLTHIVYR